MALPPWQLGMLGWGPGQAARLHLRAQLFVQSCFGIPYPRTVARAPPNIPWPPSHCYWTMAGARRRRIDTAAEASDPPSATLSSNAPAQKGAKRRKGALPSDANEPATCGGAVKKGRGRAGKSAPPAKALPPIVPAADGVSDIEDLSARVFTKEEVTQVFASHGLMCFFAVWIGSMS